MHISPWGKRLQRLPWSQIQDLQRDSQEKPGTMGLPLISPKPCLASLPTPASPLVLLIRYPSPGPLAAVPTAWDTLPVCHLLSSHPSGSSFKGSSPQESSGAILLRDPTYTRKNATRPSLPLPLVCFFLEHLFSRGRVCLTFHFMSLY